MKLTTALCYFLLYRIYRYVVKSYYPDIVMRCLIFYSVFLNNVTHLNGRAE